MNIVTCGENCRYQKDGYCVLEELNHSASSCSLCKYYEKMKD